MREARLYRLLRLGTVWLALAIGALISFAPLLWMMMSAFKPTQYVLARPPSFVSPGWPTLENFRVLSGQINIAGAFANSVLVAVATTAGVLLVNSMMAYALTQLDFPGRELLFNVILATMLIPFYLSMIPLFVIVRRLGLFDNFGGLIIPALTSPFAVYVIRQYFLTHPREICDSARVDGASELAILFQIILPISKPALAVVAVTTFQGAWNDFLWPLIVIQRKELWTMPLALIQLFQGGIGGQVIRWGQVMVMSALSTLPILILFLIFQREFVAGLTAGALKR